MLYKTCILNYIKENQSVSIITRVRTDLTLSEWSISLSSPRIVTQPSGLHGMAKDTLLSVLYS